MSESTFYFVRHVGADSGMILGATDERELAEEEIMAHAKLACAHWNRRRAARHCGEHVWGEEIELDAQVWGEDARDAWCEKCGVSREQWVVQQHEELLQ